MRKIEELESSGVTSAMLYKRKGDDGLFVKYSHGRMQWFRCDTSYFVDIESYSFWEAC